MLQWTRKILGELKRNLGKKFNDVCVETLNMLFMIPQPYSQKLRGVGSTYMKLINFMNYFRVFMNLSRSGGSVGKHEFINYCGANWSLFIEMIIAFKKMFAFSGYLICPNYHGARGDYCALVNKLKTLLQAGVRVLKSNSRRCKYSR